jgi:hypothetical protein
MEAGKKGPQPGIDRLNEDGTPMEWAIRGWQRNLNDKKGLYGESALKALRGPLDLIERAFRAGDKEKLLDIAGNTSGATFQANGFQLKDAQVLNAYALGALAWLCPQPEYQNYENSLGFKMRSGLGQETGEVAMGRAFAAAGLLGEESKREALDIIVDRNPTNGELQARQEAAVGIRRNAVVAEIKALMPVSEEGQPFVPPKMTEADWDEQRNGSTGYTPGGGH